MELITINYSPRYCTHKGRSYQSTIGSDCDLDSDKAMKNRGRVNE